MSRIRRKVSVLGLALATTAGLALAAPTASAEPAAQQGSNWFGTVGDFDWPIPGALFLNQTRDTYCTSDMVAWEQSFAAWLQDPNPTRSPVTPRSWTASNGRRERRSHPSTAC